jgi:hypothetical protein
MPPKRIILASEYRLIREMLKRAIDRVENLQVVDEVNHLSEIGDSLGVTPADWVVISLPPDKGIPAYLDKLSVDYPELRFMAVASDGSEVILRWLEPHQAALSNSSLLELLSVLSSEDLKIQSFS